MPASQSAAVAPATALVVSLLGKPPSGPRVALLATLFFATDPLNIFWTRQVMTEQFMAFFDALGMWAFIRGHQAHNKAWTAITGFLVGCAFVVKQPGIVVLGAYAVFWGLNLWKTRQRRTVIRDTMINILAMTAGF